MFVKSAYVYKNSPRILRVLKLYSWHKPFQLGVLSTPNILHTLFGVHSTSLLAHHWCAKNLVCYKHFVLYSVESYLQNYKSAKYYKR